MEFVNLLYKQGSTPFAIDTLLQLLAPMAPHITAELWALRHDGEHVHERPWPVADPALAAVDTVTLVVQVNGKLRDKLEVDAGIDEAEAERLALASPKVAEALGGGDAEAGHRPPAEARQRRRVSRRAAARRLRPRRHAHRQRQPLSRPVRKAVQRALDAGIWVVAVTGRPWQWTLDIARAHRLLPTAVVSNGAALLDVETGEVQPTGLADGTVARAHGADPGPGAERELRRRRRSSRMGHEPAFYDSTYWESPHVHVGDLAELVDLRRHQARSAGSRACRRPSSPLLLDHDVTDGVAVPYHGAGEWVELLPEGVSKASGPGAAVRAARRRAATRSWPSATAGTTSPCSSGRASAWPWATPPSTCWRSPTGSCRAPHDDGVAVLLDELLG